MTTDFPPTIHGYPQYAAGEQARTAIYERFAAVAIRGWWNLHQVSVAASKVRSRNWSEVTA